MILTMSTCYNFDSVAYNISNGNDAEALRLIKMVYAKDEDPEEILKELKNHTNKESSSISLRDATCHPKYRRGTWVAFVVCFL